MNLRDLAITSLETITAFDITTGDYKFTLDELQNASISQSQESTDITGKGGRKLATLKRNKAVTISGSNGLVSGGLMEMQTGSKFTNEDADILWSDYLVVKSNSATTTYKATGTAGKEIIAIYVQNPDGTISAELEQGSAAASGKFAYAPGTKTLTFDGITDNTNIVVKYKRKIKADVLKDASDKYSDKCTLYVDALAEDKCGNTYRVQFQIPKADFSGEFSFEMGDNQSVHSFEAQALAGACGTGGEFFSYIVFGANAEDVSGS